MLVRVRYHCICYTGLCPYHMLQVGIDLPYSLSHTIPVRSKIFSTSCCPLPSSNRPRHYWVPYHTRPIVSPQASFFSSLLCRHCVQSFILCCTSHSTIQYSQMVGGGGREELDIYFCGSIPLEGVSFWVGCSQDRYAAGHLNWIAVLFRASAHTRASTHTRTIAHTRASAHSQIWPFWGSSCSRPPC